MKSKNIIWISIGVIFLWGLSWIFTDYFLYTTGESVITDRGAFGDKFGFVNSLFSGLALAGIIISIYIQQKELKLQRDEIIETRQEFKDQNFQTTFFNLLKTQRQIADEISVWINGIVINYVEKEKSKQYLGRKFFRKSKYELLRIFESLDEANYIEYIFWDESVDQYYKTVIGHEESAAPFILNRKIGYTNKFYDISKEDWGFVHKLKPLERSRFSYLKFYNKHSAAIDHYFKHLYHIFNYLQETEKERLLKLNNEENNVEKKEEVIREFKAFANFVQAQMTTPELFLLFYHSLSYPKFQKILIYYRIFDNLTIEDLLNKEDNCIEGINLVSRDDKLHEMMKV